MEQKLYKQIDYEAIKNSKCLIDSDTTIGKKCWEWGEYIEARKKELKIDEKDQRP